MPSFVKIYGECTGPLGFPMKELDARNLDNILAEHSKDSAVSYKKSVKSNAFEYFIDKEKADVSVVTDGSVDKDKEVVEPRGIDWECFQKNPVVTLSHNYYMPPLGKSIWQKFIGGKNPRWLAKTIYADKPDDYPVGKEWYADTIWSLVKSGFMKGKSIGFLPVKWHEPTREEKEKDINLLESDLIFDCVKVFEYAVCTIGSNDNATVSDTAKCLKSLPEDLENFFPEFKQFLINSEEEPEEEIVKIPKFKGLTKEQYEGAVKSKIANSVATISKSINFDDIFARLRGQV